MFTDDHREACAKINIDIEQSYKHLLLEIRVGNSDGIMKHLLHDIRNPPNQPPISLRQRQVLLGYAAGHSQQTIAADLGITVWTVSEHISSVRKRLHAKTTTHAVAIAIRLGLIPTKEEGT